MGDALKLLNGSNRTAILLCHSQTLQGSQDARIQGQHQHQLLFVLIGCLLGFLASWLGLLLSLDSLWFVFPILD